jgi:hypothetical protein
VCACECACIDGGVVWQLRACEEGRRLLEERVAEGSSARQALSEDRDRAVKEAAAAHATNRALELRVTALEAALADLRGAAADAAVEAGAAAARAHEAARERDGALEEKAYALETLAKFEHKLATHQHRVAAETYAQKGSAITVDALMRQRVGKSAALGASLRAGIPPAATYTLPGGT